MAKKKKREEEAYNIHETENYNTLFLGKQPEEKDKGKFKGDAVANLVDLITNPQNRHLKVDALRELKSKNGKELLMQAIGITQDEARLALLCSACWEANLDFSDRLKEFVQMAVEKNYLVALEILTVIEDMQGPFRKEELHAAIKVFETEIGKDRTAEKNELYADMLQALRSKPE
ncbi:MAG: hypothetical protein AB1458_13565 [Bacteroidota bacterium]